MKVKLLLNHVQRLQLHALIGQQRANVGEMRALWRLQDRLTLTTDEAQAIGLRFEIQNGTEFPLWNKAAPCVDAEVEIDVADIERLRKLLRECGVLTPAARVWLAPLLDQLGQ